MIIGTDKLSYWTLEDRLLGIPAKTYMNGQIILMRNGGETEARIDEWIARTRAYVGETGEADAAVRREAEA